MHGGSAIYVKQGIKFQEMKDLVRKSVEKILEISAVDVKMGPRNILILSVYTTPGQTKEFIKKFEEILQLICWTNKTVVIAGDFNINLLDKSHKNTICFVELLNSYGLNVSIDVPTRSTLVTKTCIDNILINQSNFTSQIIRTHISDHDTAQLLTLQEEIEQTEEYQYKRNITANNIQDLIERLTLLDWNAVYKIPEKEVDQQWRTFTNMFKTELDYACPIRKNKTTARRQQKPINDNITKCKTRLDILHTCKTFNPVFMGAYKEVKKEYDKMLRDEKRERYKQQILQSDNKMKTLWQTVAKIKNNTKINKEIPGNPLEIANNFNRHFATAAEEKIKQNQNIPFQNDITRNSNNFKFRLITEEETLKIIGKLKNKNSSGIDDIPMCTVKACMNQTATPLAYLVNNSMKHGVFPELLKKALIKPIYKKGKENEPENYRPISLLPAFSKILELAISEQLVDFLINEEILSSTQHGYVKGKSTTTATFQFITDVLNALEDSKVVIALLLDLSKAFDTLFHKYILNKLDSYGIRGKEKEWFRSYLSNRKQQVIIDGNGTRTLSEEALIQFGVPQGSILGPILFIIFINDLMSVLRSDPNTSMVNYADDTSFILKADILPQIADLVQSILQQANHWFQSNNLCLNVEKTCAIIIKTTHANFQTPSHIQLNDSKLDLQTSGRFLGLTIDENLNWDEHITGLCTKLGSICYSLGVLRNYLDSSSMRVVYQATFEAKIRYGIMFYGSGNNMKQVLKMQKRAIRTMMRMPCRETCRGIFRKHGLLTAIAIHIQECLIFVFKNRNCFETKTSTKYDTRTTQLKYPIHKLSLTEKGPEYRCIKYYNRLSNQMRDITNLKLFKKEVYKLLLQIEPYTVEEFLVHNI